MLPLSRRICGSIAGLGLVLLLVFQARRAHPERAPKPAVKGAIQPILKPDPAKARLIGSYGKLPLSFEANQGKSSKQVKFLNRGPGYTLFYATLRSAHLPGCAPAGQ